MALMRTSNPALSQRAFSNFGRPGQLTDRMTIEGTVNKSFFLIAIVIAMAAWSWQMTLPTGGWTADSTQATIPAWYFPVIIGTFILSLVLIFKQNLAPILAPIYAVGEGLLLGTISAVFDARYPGIAIQAVLCTGAVFITLLLAYKSKLIPVTDRLRLGIVAATGGIFVVYLVTAVLNLFGIHVPYSHQGGALGIGISLVIVVIAALNLLLDFDFIERSAEQGAPKYMEWYASFALLVTLVWLYLEMLRLLSKSKD